MSRGQTFHEVRKLLGNTAPARTTINRWHFRMASGAISLCVVDYFLANLGDEGFEDEPRPGRPRVYNGSAVVNVPNQQKKEQQKSSLRAVSAIVGTYPSTVSRILHGEGKSPKSPFQIPHSLTAAQKKKRVEIATENLALYSRSDLGKVLAQACIFDCFETHFQFLGRKIRPLSQSFSPACLGIS